MALISMASASRTSSSFNCSTRARIRPTDLSRLFTTIHTSQALCYSRSRKQRQNCQLSATWADQRRYVSLNVKGHIAVVGGGLTGLTTAYYLAKQLPSTAKITLYEGSDRLGGWIKTDRVPVDVDGVKGTVSFERGPRTLSSLHTSTWRFDDLVLYDMALDLGLELFTPRDQPRYIYYPDHIVKMPPTATIAECIREPLFQKSFFAALGFLSRRLRFQLRRSLTSYDPPQRDMSISEWLYEVTGSTSVAENFASAMTHGIYGGNIDFLSAWSVLERFCVMYHAPACGADFRIMPVRERELLSELAHDPEIRRMALKAQGTLLHFGGHGLESLPKALENALSKTANVEIKKGRPVTDISFDATKEKVNITTGSWGKPQHRPGQSTNTSSSSSASTCSYDRVISTLTSHDLARITNGKLPLLEDTRSVSIMTVNLWYPQKNLKPPGFGYLIPRSVSHKQNPERALGVFYDSDVGAAASPDEPPGTKLFVLMGGHYYDSGAPPPSEAEAINQAKALLERHLGIPADTPCFALSRFAKECIPQHFVGHVKRLQIAHLLLAEDFNGRLAVAGGSYSKIGVLGSVRAGYEIARQTVQSSDGWKTTGLEPLLDWPGPFEVVPVSEISVRNL
ncbi:hypothetical protein E4U23_004913 [Claviceps purpurea]|nr:hypothetical protein E4U23_004913 [Claviceps purpurea]